MFKIVLISAFAIVASAQHNGNYHQNPKTAAIISEQRYLSGDGKFGAAYTQEDGTDFKEETDADGTRHGQYSYIDPNGQKKTVKYTAGKNGFQATGDHLPVAPVAPPQQAPQPQYNPQPQYQPQNNFQHQPQQQQQSNNYNDNNNYDDGQYDPRLNDPSFSQGDAAPAQHFQQAPAPVQQQQQPQVNYNQHFNQQQQQHQHVPQYTTESSHRFQPPGKLSLNRTPDGFSYSFNKV